MRSPYAAVCVDKTAVAVTAEAAAGGIISGHISISSGMPQGQHQQLAGHVGILG
jgi:hypothetical protein